MNDEKCYYILDARTVVGNCALWWGPDRRGYVCDLNLAGLYTRAEAFEQNGHRSSDIPVHVDDAKAASVLHVRRDALLREGEAANMFSAWVDDQIEAEREAGKLSGSELSEVLEINPFGERDYDHEFIVLRDSIVRAAKQHECHDCGSEIEKGLDHRCRVEKHARSNSAVTSYRWCHDCTRLHVGYPYGEQQFAER